MNKPPAIKGKKIKKIISEFTGALGDLGTFVPIFICLVALNGLNGTVILSLTGLMYIACGIYYRLPVPVQPLKALAAIAITLGLGGQVIYAASIVIGIILLFLAVTNFTKFLPRIFTLPIIKGMQFGLGLILIKTSLLLFIKDTHGFDRLDAGMAAVLNLPHFKILLPSLDSFKQAVFLLVIPQLPLTLSNAIVGTRDIAHKFFEGKAERLTERSLSFGMGLVNVLSGFVGGMPLCHGSSGLTAHYLFGARTGAASIIMGAIYLISAFVLGDKAGLVFNMIPHRILGVMLFLVGFRHACLIRDLNNSKEFLLALIIGLISVLFNNLTLGLLLGLMVSHVPKFAVRISLLLRDPIGSTDWR